MARRPSFWGRSLPLILILALLVTPLACGVNQDLVGSWKLTHSADPVLVPGLLFEFKADRSLEIRLGTARMDPEDREAFEEAYGGMKLSYLSNPDGSLTLHMTRKDQAAAQLKMTYELAGNMLTITDEEGVSLVFFRQEAEGS